MNRYNEHKNVEGRLLSSSSLEKNRRKRESSPEETGRKRPKKTGVNYFDELPDDLVLSILSKLISSATAPLHHVNALLTCKRFNKLGLHRAVLTEASVGCVAVRAKNWSDSAHRFLRLCVDAGNLQASFILGMIQFYCMNDRRTGASLMAKAAIGLHAPALYSLAVIQFNGSGGTKNDKDLRAGVALCARSAALCHVDALRELGHCLQDGYGVRRNVNEGRRLLFHANTAELAAANANTKGFSCQDFHSQVQANAVKNGVELGCPLLSDYGCNLPAPELHPANRFLVEWFGTRGFEGEKEGLRLCSNSGCGRPETRRHEFRRCAVCGAANYCSRACQALDWKLCHKANCELLARLVLNGGELADENEENGDVDSMEDTEGIE